MSDTPIFSEGWWYEIMGEKREYAVNFNPAVYVYSEMAVRAIVLKAIDEAKQEIERLKRLRPAWTEKVSEINNSELERLSREIKSTTED